MIFNLVGKGGGSDLVPVSMAVTGSWTNEQLVGQAPDTTGLTFTVTYQTKQVTPSVSPATYPSTGSQTVTFSYTENGTTVTASKTATVIRKPVSLSVSGSWTNTQFVGSAMDTTGLTFTVTYNNGSTATVTPTKSPSTWTSSGTQTATFTYTENGTTVSTTKTATVVAVALSSIAVSGSWSNTQYINTAVDTTGLTVTATFSNGTTSNVTSSATVSPSTWGSTAGTQTATFSYTYNGVTKTATKTATVEQKATPPTPTDRKSVGGIIFYIDSTANGTYTFYNAQGTQVSAPTVGTDCTGWTYEVTGATKDKFYVVYNELYTSKRWTYYSNGAYVYTSLGVTAKDIGAGKTNTATVMSADSGAYITSDSNGYPTVWYQIQQMRTNKVGGCDDWFVGSEYELDALRTSGAGNSATWFSGNFIWTSSESSADSVRAWHYGGSGWFNLYKRSSSCVCGVRAF